MAVDIIRSELESSLSHGLAPFASLHQAITLANDQISYKNNQEHRQERRRMGTTLVTAVTIDHLIYLAHVGDSRAYWLTPHSCRQVTLDDDLACRHVRLGFGPYRSALQNGNSGALVQALGMAEDLTPTIQSLFLDQEALFLLCSDGLSDHDLVEEIWSEELIPIFHKTCSLEAAVDRLITLANHRNGHDNVTVALLHYQVIQGQTPDSAALCSILATPESVSPSIINVGLAPTDNGWIEETSGFQTSRDVASPLRRATSLTPTSHLGHRLHLGLVLVMVVGIIIGLCLFLWPSSPSPPGPLPDQKSQ